MCCITTSCQSVNLNSHGYIRDPIRRSSLDHLESERYNYVSIVQGYTNEEKTHISIVTGQKNRYFVYEKGNSRTRREVKPFKTVTFRNWRILKLKISGLSLKKSYILEVIDENLQVIDERVFKALDLSKANPTIVVGSCIHDGKQVFQQKTLWSNIIYHKPDVIFLIGDNVYVDSSYRLKRIAKEAVNPQRMFKRYIETRLHVPFYYSRTLFPTLAVWDDHDFGINDGDSSFRYAKESKRVFELFWAQKPLEKGPGVSSLFSAFGQNFLFLDNRSFRSSPENQIQSHFGELQEKWLTRQLQKHKKPSWLISGGQFFGGVYPWESYERNHPQAFVKFKNRLKRFSQPLLFLSGDRHFSEIMRVFKTDIAQETFEITTSPLHSFLYPNHWKTYPNPRQIVGKASMINYTVLKPRVEFIRKEDLGGNIKVQVTVYGVGKKILFQENLTILGKI